MLLQDNWTSFTPQELYMGVVSKALVWEIVHALITYNHLFHVQVTAYPHPLNRIWRRLPMSKTSAKVENVTNDNLSRNNLTSWENGKKPNERCKKKETRRKPEESASCPKRRKKQKAFILTTGEDLISDISLCVYM